MKHAIFIVSIIILQSVHLAYSQRRCRFGAILVNETTCVACEPGTFEERNECLPCPPGTFVQFAFARFCRPCPIGRFASRFGMERCEFCPRNSAAPNEGSAECTSSCRNGCPQCAPGFGYNAERNRCTKCAPGTISSVFSATPCFPCSGGSIPNEDQTKCICPPGLLNGPITTATRSCTECPSGASSPDGIRCVCEPGRTPNRSNGELSFCSCPLGMTDVDGKCVECTLADVVNIGCRLCFPGTGRVGDRCERCKRNTVSADSSLESCQECPDGLMPNRFRTDCICPRRMAMNGDGVCEICPPGTEWSPFSGMCNSCRLQGGISRRPGSLLCRQCPLRWKPNSSGTRCIRS